MDKRCFKVCLIGVAVIVESKKLVSFPDFAIVSFLSQPSDRLTPWLRLNLPE